MADRLPEKTHRYEALLDEALANSTIAPTSNDERRAVAAAHMEMAEAYLADGRHFQAEDDFVNALAAYSYGHGWLDAAIRTGVVETSGEPQEVQPSGV